EVEWDRIRRSAFRKCWTAHASAGRFHSARASVADLASFLNEDERKDVMAKIDENSRAAARTFHTNLLKMLPPQNTWESFIRGSSEEIESGLALPNAEELDAADEELKWARRCREQLLQARGRKDLPTAAFNVFLDGLVRTAETCVQAAGRLRDAKDRAFPGLEAL